MSFPRTAATVPSGPQTPSLAVSRPPAPTIFIGNIPYDLSESQLVEIFQEVGPVKSLRLVSDRESGKAKGYGFCEYFDVSTAEGAVRNLNGHEVHGRQLRVDFADEHIARVPKEKETTTTTQQQQPSSTTEGIGLSAVKAAACQMSFLLGGSGAVLSDTPPIGGSNEKLYEVLAGMTKMEVFEVLSALKSLVQSNFNQARQLLIQNPQLARSLFQVEVMLGLVDAPGLPSSPEGPQEPSTFMQHSYVKEETREHPGNMNGRGEVSGEGALLHPTIGATNPEPQGAPVNQVVLPGVALPQQIQVPPPPPHIVPQMTPGLPGVTQQVINMANPAQMVPGQMGLPDLQNTATQQFNVQGESGSKIGEPIFGVLSGSGQPPILHPSNLGAAGVGVRSETFGGDMVVAANMNPFNGHLGQAGVVQNQAIMGGLGSLQNSSAVANVGGVQDNEFMVTSSQSGPHPMVMDVDQSPGDGGTQAALDGGRKALLDQVMSLTATQIDLLPSEQRSQVLALQQQLVVKDILELTDDIQSGPVGLIGLRIARCLHRTKDVSHMHVAYLLSVLGCQLTSLDYQAEAEIVHRRSLCLAMGILGKNHHDLTCAMDWLAYSLLRQGNYKESVLLCYTSMHLTVAHVGVWHPDTANCYSNLATVLETMGLTEHAQGIRAAGRTIFSLVGNPYMVLSWQGYYGGMGQVSLQTPAVPLDGCASSCVSSVESCLTRKVNGLIDDILVGITDGCIEVGQSREVSEEGFELGTVRSPTTSSQGVDSHSRDSKHSSGSNSHLGVSQEVDEKYLGEDTARSVLINSVTGMPVATALKDGKSSESVGSEKSEEDFTIGVGRSQAEGSREQSSVS